MYGDGAKIQAVRPCTRCNGGHDQKVEDAKLRADIPRDRSLKDFDWTIYGEDLTRQKAIIGGFVDCFPDFEAEGYGLYIHSRIRGSGKTFLASAIAGELAERYAAAIRFVSASDLIEISKRKTEDGSDPLDDLISVRVLILDDLGQKSTGRDWMTDILFRIIDKRYTKHRITIVTSNVPSGELDLDDRVVDRINATTYKVKLPEFCVRTVESNSRKRAFLQKIGIE